MERQEAEEGGSRKNDKVTRTSKMSSEVSGATCDSRRLAVYEFSGFLFFN